MPAPPQVIQLPVVPSVSVMDVQAGVSGEPVRLHPPQVATVVTAGDGVTTMDVPFPWFTNFRAAPVKYGVVWPSSVNVLSGKFAVPPCPLW